MRAQSGVYPGRGRCLRGARHPCQEQQDKALQMFYFQTKDEPWYIYLYEMALLRTRCGPMQK